MWLVFGLWLISVCGFLLIWLDSLVLGLLACSWLGSGFRFSFPLVLVSWVGVG